MLFALRADAILWIEINLVDLNWPKRLFFKFSQMKGETMIARTIYSWRHNTHRLQ